MSVDCLTALLKDIRGHSALGLLLGVEERHLKAIDSYYEDKEHKIMHMITLWLIKDPDDPVTQLRDALNALDKHDLSQILVLLSSFGKSSHRIFLYYWIA